MKTQNLLFKILFLSLLLGVSCLCSCAFHEHFDAYADDKDAQESLSTKGSVWALSPALGLSIPFKNDLTLRRSALRVSQNDDLTLNLSGIICDQDGKNHLSYQDLNGQSYALHDKDVSEIDLNVHGVIKIKVGQSAFEFDNVKKIKDQNEITASYKGQTIVFKAVENIAQSSFKDVFSSYDNGSTRFFLSDLKDQSRYKDQIFSSQRAYLMLKNNLTFNCPSPSSDTCSFYGLQINEDQAQNPPITVIRFVALDNQTKKSVILDSFNVDSQNPRYGYFELTNLNASSLDKHFYAKIGLNASKEFELKLDHNYQSLQSDFVLLGQFQVFPYKSIDQLSLTSTLTFDPNTDYKVIYSMNLRALGLKDQEVPSLDQSFKSHQLTPSPLISSSVPLYYEEGFFPQVSSTELKTVDYGQEFFSKATNPSYADAKIVLFKKGRHLIVDQTQWKDDQQKLLQLSHDYFYPLQYAPLIASLQVSEALLYQSDSSALWAHYIPSDEIWVYQITYKDPSSKETKTMTSPDERPLFILEKQHQGASIFHKGVDQKQQVYFLNAMQTFLTPYQAPSGGTTWEHTYYPSHLQQSETMHFTLDQKPSDISALNAWGAQSSFGSGFTTKGHTYGAWTEDKRWISFTSTEASSSSSVHLDLLLKVTASTDLINHQAFTYNPMTTSEFNSFYQYYNSAKLYSDSDKTFYLKTP